MIGYAAVCMGVILASVVHDKKLFQAQFVQGGGKKGDGDNVTSASTLIVLQYLLYTEVTTVCVLILTASMAFILYFFLAYHLSLVFRGMTTNESYKWSEVSDYHKRIVKAHLAVVGFVESGELPQKVLAADPAVVRKEGREEEGGKEGEEAKEGKQFVGRHHEHDHGAAAAAVAPSAFFAQPTASAAAATGAADGGGAGVGGGSARKSRKEGTREEEEEDEDEDEEAEDEEEEEEEEEEDDDEAEEPQFELSAIPQPSSSSSSPTASGASGSGGGGGGSGRVEKPRPSLEAAVQRWRKEVAAGARLHHRSLPPLGALMNHPGPVPVNMYNMGAWANLMEVLFPRSKRRKAELRLERGLASGGGRLKTD